MAIELTDLKKEFGLYYKDGGQNIKDLYKKLNQRGVTELFMTPINTDDTVYQSAVVKANKLLQGFQSGWTPKGGMTVLPNTIKQFHFKIDDEIDPNTIEDNWLGFLSGPDIERSSWPVAKYMPEKIYIPGIEEDFELDEIFHGVFQTPTAGTANPSGKNMNGLKIQLIKHIRSTRANKVVLGTLTQASIVDQVNMMARQLSEVYQSVPMNIYMSMYWRNMYNDENKKKPYNAFRNLQEDVIEGTMCTIKPLPSMHGNDTIFITPNDNMISLRKRSAGFTKIKVEESKRQLYFMTDFWRGAGFIMPEVIWAYVPEAEINAFTDTQLAEV